MREITKANGPLIITEFTDKASNKKHHVEFSNGKYQLITCEYVENK